VQRQGAQHGHHHRAASSPSASLSSFLEPELAYRLLWAFAMKIQDIAGPESLADALESA